MINTFFTAMSDYDRHDGAIIRLGGHDAKRQLHRTRPGRRSPGARRDLDRHPAKPDRRRAYTRRALNFGHRDVASPRPIFGGVIKIFFYFFRPQFLQVFAPPTRYAFVEQFAKVSLSSLQIPSIEVF